MAGKAKIARGALSALTDIGSDITRRDFMKGVGATAATGALVGLKGAPKLFDDLVPVAKKAVKGGQKINLTDLISFKQSDKDVHEAIADSWLRSFSKYHPVHKKGNPENVPLYDRELDSVWETHTELMNEVASDVFDDYLLGKIELEDIYKISKISNRPVDFIAPIIRELESKGLSKKEMANLLSDQGAYRASDEAVDKFKINLDLSPQYKAD